MAKQIVRTACLLAVFFCMDRMAVAQASVGSVAIQGVERATQIATVAMAGSGSVTIQGWEQSTSSSGGLREFCEIDGVCPSNGPIFDSGTIALIVNGYMASANYGSGSTSESIASALAMGFNYNPASPVTATVSGSTITLRARVLGASTNYALSASYSFDDADFSFPSFTADTAELLTGGQDAGTLTVYDTGTVSANISSHPQTVTYGQGDTAISVATRLAEAFNADCNSLFAASAWSDDSGAYVDFQFKQGGSGAGYILGLSSASNSAYFSGTAFPVNVRPLPPTKYFSVTLPARATVGGTCDGRNAWQSLSADQQSTKLQEMQNLIAANAQQARQDMQDTQAQFGWEGGSPDSPVAHNLVNVNSASVFAPISFVDQSGAPVANPVDMTSSAFQIISGALASPTAGIAPLTVNFQRSFQLDHWDFGDGQTSASLASKTIVHIYQNPGVYSATPFFRNVIITRTLPPVSHTTITAGTPVNIIVFAASSDADHDGLPETIESQISGSFTPFYHVSAGEKSGTGFATFFDQIPQTVAHTFGAVPPISHYRVTPLGFGLINGQQFGFLEIDYLTLWNRDDGLSISGSCKAGLATLGGLIGFTAAELLQGVQSHPLDNERSGVLVAAPTVSPNTYDLNPVHYGAYSVYLAAHEFTINDHSQFFFVRDFAHPAPSGSHPEIWLSRAKHASYAANPNGITLTPEPIIIAIYATLDALLAVGRINSWEFLVYTFLADETIYGCFVERFTEQGISSAQTRTNVGELSAPLNGSGFINDPEPTMGLQRKLSMPLWILK